ncbi:hypothetical protein ETH_00037905, partial [Eimeria tenella]
MKGRSTRWRVWIIRCCCSLLPKREKSNKLSKCSVLSNNC